MESIKTLYSNCQSSLLNLFDKTTIKLITYVSGEPIDERLISLNHQLNKKLATENFNSILLSCGLIPLQFISETKIKFWQYFLYTCYLIAIIKILIFLIFLDPINDYDLCVLLGKKKNKAAKTTQIKTASLLIHVLIKVCVFKVC